MIELTGMEFRAFHGCLPEERKNGNLFIVDFRCDYDISAAAESDALEDTLDYSAIYDIVRREMETPSNLLENVAGRIAAAISAAFPELEHFYIKVSKRNPPVGGKARWASVSLEK